MFSQSALGSVRKEISHQEAIHERALGSRGGVGWGLQDKHQGWSQEGLGEAHCGWNRVDERGMAPEQWVSEVDLLKTLSFYSECRGKH